MTSPSRRAAIALLTTCAVGGAIVTPAAHAETTVHNYGTCVSYGFSPSEKQAAPGTYVVTDGQLEARGLPHMSVDGTAPPAFAGSGWMGCGR